MHRRLGTLALAITFSTGIAASQLPPETHPLVAPLSVNARELLDESMQLMDASYNSKAHLILRPHDGHTGVTRYMVRESSWYALGLLMRDRDGKHPDDTKRAIDLITTVLDNQYLDPQAKWYGTFKYSPEEPTPNSDSSAFRGYDPNWRHFIGTTFEMILVEYPNKIPAELKQRMYSSIDAAINGEIHDGRLVPSYSNIALMYGALWNFTAVHDGNQEWLKQSAAWNDEVFRLFKRENTFDEFNAPTYYGVDLYGLGLWREYGSTSHMREMARTMEAGLWHDIAELYHPTLRNMVGPYDRAYGMDMTAYVSPTGVWMRSIMSGPKAPLPEHPTLGTYQVGDLWYAPQVVLLGTKIPAETQAKLNKFSSPHFIRRTIDPQRTATASVGETAMWGGESTSLTKDSGNQTQFHPATMQWRMPSGTIGWIKVTHSPDIDAVADRNGISLLTNGDITIRIFAGGAATNLTQKQWTLPGLNVLVQTNATTFTSKHAIDCEECIDLTYTNVKSLRMDFSTITGADRTP
jgi:hypothetical protein